MPIEAEFEEKEYEASLYLQLARGSNRVWCPGQVFEGYLGVDAALKVQTVKIWRKLGYPAPLSGVILNDMRLGYLWKHRKKRLLPKFSLNLFIQAKRPQQMRRRSSAMVKNGLKSPCYRFEIRPHQQKALERLHRKIRNRGLVIYACPVSTDLEWLYDHIEKGTLIENSTFPKAIHLNGHKVWAFDRPGAYGLCCSEPEKIEGTGLVDSINRVCESWNPTHEEQSGQYTFLSELAEYIPEIIEDTDRSSVMEKYLKRIDSLFNEVDHRFSLIARDYTKVSFFCRLYDLNWLVLS